MTDLPHPRHPDLETALDAARRGDRDAALGLIAGLLHERPDYYEAWVIYALLTDDRKQAVRCWQEAVRLRPADHNARRTLQALIHAASSDEPVSLDEAWVSMVGEPADQPVPPVPPVSLEAARPAPPPPLPDQPPLVTAPLQAAAPAKPGKRNNRLSVWWYQVRRDWRIFRANRLAMIGLALLMIFGLMAIIHPILLGTPIMPRGMYDPQTGFDASIQPWPYGPTRGHLLGIDSMGRDNLSVLLASTRPSFGLAISASLTMAVVATLIAVVSAYWRGPLDSVLSNLSNAMLVLPVPIVMVILGARFYAEIGTLEFGLLFGLLTGASSAAIVLRAQALMLMNRPFIEAARVSGAGPWHIITRHLIPHLMPLVLIHMMLTVAGAVIADGFIAFLGLRTDIRLNWGTMVFNAIAFTMVNPTIPWIALLAPTLSLSSFSAAFYFIARGLHDVADPRLQGR